MKTTGLVFLAALALAGCGGGGGNPGTCFGSPRVCDGVGGDPSPGGGGGGSDSAVGRYQGTSDTGRSVSTLVLESGQVWVLYGQSGNASLLGGAQQGTYSAEDGEIDAPDLADFNALTGSVRRGTLAGTYVSERSIAASVVIAGDAATIAGTYDADSDTPADLADAAGSYEGVLAAVDGSDTASLTVAANGTLTGASTGGCTITGTLLPATSARAFTLSATLSGGACGNEVLSYAGVAILQGQRIYGAGFTGGRVEGFTFSGGR